MKMCIEDSMLKKPTATKILRSTLIEGNVGGSWEKSRIPRLSLWSLPERSEARDE